VAQIIAQVNSLTAQVTSLQEKTAKSNENTQKIDQMHTVIEGIDARVKELESAPGEDVTTHARGTSAGSRSVSNKHPLLKVCRDRVSPMPSALKTLACGAHNVLSVVWSGRVREKRGMYQ
jgi:outer membrane murein-binding lipoprotein Lpp